MEKGKEIILKELASQDDGQAFSLIFSEFYGKVLSFTMVYTKDIVTAEDICLEVFVKLWKMRSRLCEIVDLDSYLFSMSRNAVLDWFRKNARYNTLPLESISEGDAGWTSIEGKIVAGQELDTIRKAVDKFPGRRREIFVMSRFMGFDNEEIARRLGISRKTVENQINLANREIRKLSLMFLGALLLS